MTEKTKWYVVHTYSGHENKVKANIEKLVENRGMEDAIHEVVVPTEEVVEIKNGKKKVKQKKIYLFIRHYEIFIDQALCTQ